MVANTVVNGIFKKPNQATLGEGPATGSEVQITITFTPPIVLPAPPSPLNHYFFRPEAQVTGGNFLLYIPKTLSGVTSRGAYATGTRDGRIPDSAAFDLARPI